MPYKLTGTLTALLFYGFFFSISSILFPPLPAIAQLSELSEIQNGIFYLSHKKTTFNPETFNNDQYIDDDQSDFFIKASKIEPNIHAEEGYAFSLVDHYILDSDLEIEYDYNKVLCSAFPKVRYLSIHNVSISDYTDQKSPPAVFFAVINGTEPFHKEKVKAITWEFNNYELEKDESIHNYPFSECNVDGYMINTSIRVISGRIAVWVGQTYSLKYSCSLNSKPQKDESQNIAIHPTTWGISLPWGQCHSRLENTEAQTKIKNYPDSAKNDL